MTLMALMALMGASFNDEALRRGFVPRLLAWRWFCNGMEAIMSLGISEEQGHQREALEAVATWLRLVEACARKAPAARRRT